MPNNHVLQRLTGIQTILRGLHQAGARMSASSRGAERQAFIDYFLANVLPPIYRFGTGDATDATGRNSGQLDIVVEYPISPTLPLSLPKVGSTTRLYLAESIAAVIEVKSNVTAQWDEARWTATKLAPLRRSISLGFTMGEVPENIPLFIGSYMGWKRPSTLQNKLEECPDIAGILIIDSGLFVTSLYGGSVYTGPWALWGLICTLHRITNALQAASGDPMAYAP